jgi:hypothetical protein
MVRLLLLFVSWLMSAQGISQIQPLPSIEVKTAGMLPKPGLLPLYWEEATGKIWLEVSQLDSALLYQTSLPGGLGSNDIGLDRGMLGETKMVRFSKTGRKLLMVQPNYAYRASSNSPTERRAVEESFAQSVIAGFTIEAATGNRYLVDATDFFLRDAVKAGQRIRNMQQGNFAFDKSRSAIYLPNTKNFPLNTEVEATITLTNTDGTVGNFVQSVAPSPDAITLRMHHSFVQLPDNQYKPRVFDPRSSFINIAYFDYSTPIDEPIEKRFIIRHRLQKKEPQAALSNPVQPIVYYLDKGVPEPVRTALLTGAMWWNEAFTAAGYRNAFQVMALPDTADPMDIRYNMINWVHRSTRGWSYGASVVDPRTGEIIKGQVTLGSLRVRQDYLITMGLLAPYTGANDATPDEKWRELALRRLAQLAAHEVGHTLGLVHNYAASANDRASVMDYPHPLVTIGPNGELDLKKVYTNQIGEWDKVAINWGYREFTGSERIGLNSILTDAQQRGLQFIADRDARAPGGLHPTAHLWDNGPNVVAELKNVLQVRKKALIRFGRGNIPAGSPMALLEDVLVPIYFYHRYQLEAVTKLVGGLQYNYALKGDGQTVTQPLPKALQLEALQAAMDCVTPDALRLPDSVIALIPPRPLGYNPTRELFNKRTGLAFDALAPAETAAGYAFYFLLHPERLNRMAQYPALHGGLGIGEMVDILLQRTWKAPRRNGMEGLIQQQTEQVLLTYLLAASVDEQLSFAAKAAIVQKIDGLKQYLSTQQKTVQDNGLAAHYLLAIERMKSPDKAKPTIQIKDIPPGAPIGCGEE